MAEDKRPFGEEHPCPQCGSLFTCGLGAMHETCWCFRFPHVLTAQTASREGCLCPNCLTKLVETIQYHKRSKENGA